MIRSLRRSFAAKLIVGGCLLALVVVGGVASYLIYSRAQQTMAAAQSNADNRVGVMAEVLNRFTGVQSLSAASGLAGQPALRTALASPNPAAAVPAIFAASTPVDLDGEVLLITDAHGAVVYNRNSPTLGGALVVTGAPEAVHVALGLGQCARQGQSAIVGGCGIEVIGQTPAYIVALPVVAAGHPVGVVAYLAPLAYQLTRFQALFNFPTAFIPASNPAQELRPNSGGSAPTDPGLQASLAVTGTTHRAIYNAPVGGGATAAVAATFVSVYDAGGTLTGYIGVEVPLSQFVGDERTDILVVALISIFLVLVVAIAVILFVERFVKRPIARLEGGVARIAGGDYATDIPVRSQDELGRLASNVNRMRDAIAGYVRQVEEARERLDHALEQVSGVSRALTTTTAGVPTLQQAVVRTAASIGGGPRSAMLAMRDADADTLTVVATEGDPPELSTWAGVDAVLAGHTLRLDDRDHGSLVAVPMFYQDRVVGTLITVTPAESGVPVSDSDVDVLAVLANNAAIAMENARLFEQERETVRRLLELNSLKTDFLSTVQHELRTPLTAILGLADLLEMCWTMWEEAPKLEAVRDIQVAAKNLYDIVETIIDYSVMDNDQLGLNPTRRPAARDHHQHHGPGR